MKVSTFETLKHDDLAFVKIKANLPFSRDELKYVDGVIIEYTDQKTVFNVLSNIRNHNDKAIYLLPVFIYKIHRANDKQIARLADGIVHNLSDLTAAAAKTQQIKKKLKKMN